MVAPGQGVHGICIAHNAPHAEQWLLHHRRREDVVPINPRFRWRLLGSLVTVLVGLVSAPIAQQLPATNHFQYFGYFGSDGRDGDYTTVVRPYTNTYVADPCGYDTFTYPCPAQDQLAISLQKAISNGQYIYLLLGNHDDNVVNLTLDAARPFWEHVTLVEGSHEPSGDEKTETGMQVRIDHLKNLIAAKGLPSKPMGALVGLDDATTITGVFATSLNFVSVEAYAAPPGATGDADGVQTTLAAAKAHIPVGKNILFVTMAYNRNGAYTNIAELVKLQDSPYVRAFNDSRVVGILMFSYGRPGGTNSFPELKLRHVRQNEGLAKSFTGDYQADLIWRDSVTGNNVYWLMNGRNFVTNGNLWSVADVNWEMRAVGDFDGNNQPDLIWQNKSNGQVAAWLYASGLSVIGSPTFATETDTNWKIVGAGDMDRDGQTDLVWRNPATGALRIWHMKWDVATQALSKRDSVTIGVVGPTAASLWEVAGVADMNGDTYPDLIWRQYASPFSLAAWFLTDATVIATPYMTPATNVDPAWRIVAVADIGDDNGVRDGHPDLVWQRDGSNDIAVWYMGGSDGLTALQTVFMNPDHIDPSSTYRIVGAR
jgi:hypothetical protein